MVAALCAAIMLLGQVTGVGLYMSPMLCGILLLPVGGLFGKKTQAFFSREGRKRKLPLAVFDMLCYNKMTYADNRLIRLFFYAICVYHTF